MNNEINNNYSTFAEKYDQLFDSELYQEWVDFVTKSSKATSIMDLGGGAGRLAVLLAQLGYTVDVLDLSPEMLSLAQKHANDANVDLALLQADMRDFSDWKKEYPIIVSFADALNYLPNLPDFKLAIQQVYDHLAVGGQFLFDVITPYQVNVLYDNYYYNNDDDDENIFMWTSYPGEQENSVDHDLKFFVYDGAIDAFKIMREIHHEQTYDLKTYQETLKNAGFHDIEVFANFGQNDIVESTERWFFRAVK
ncbi:class I SAM-dependent DNA methyltransferase [Leuconostoc suionicum]|uniref:class I SAM-dependent DNA methyltransferase n=1 Tax=Leuconostoc suionicum TaxID=1511761 RepID=UPI0024AD16A5|nr:class I SAM-dependent methyltransferase [Leuconostoc suionicum]MDI6523680.1 class I SAM-dependent methyltransferase [Leuconostoc suionicum]MDI6544646.1 class I SAM-dependent methyltransferase [Leuconostoc suionicum]MDI6551933.1 class I SAM-dependent methyltransferase [Leuconostoc suionicum]MDI6649980.1 class I SAM-dependent methyltransferase [Leuconostoc suionicum]MDI6681553.1 class I SAM-dependent methyltransferase [Leuconostoc suionicum]